MSKVRITGGRRDDMTDLEKELSQVAESAHNMIGRLIIKRMQLSDHFDVLNDYIEQIVEFTGHQRIGNMYNTIRRDLDDVKATLNELNRSVVDFM